VKKVAGADAAQSVYRAGDNLSRADRNEGNGRIMGFISKSFSVKKLASSLRRKKDLDKRAGANRGANNAAQGSAVATLDRYIYDNLYIPIVRDGRVPIRGLDIARLTEDELNKLSDALTRCNTREYVRLGLIFESLRPAASQKQMFI
jgi:hypothetical protein